MKKTKFMQRLLSMALCLSMVLSLLLGILPGMEISAYAAVDLLTEDEKKAFRVADVLGSLLNIGQRMELYNDDKFRKFTVQIEAGSNNDPNASRVWIDQKVDNDFPAFDSFIGLFTNVDGYYWEGNNEPNLDLTKTMICANTADNVIMTGGNVGGVALSCKALVYKDPIVGIELRRIDSVNASIQGGKIGTLLTAGVEGDANIKVENAEIGRIYGTYYGASDVDGDLNLTISNATVGEINIAGPSGFRGYLWGDVYLRIENSTVGMIYTDPIDMGTTHTGYITSGKIDKVGYFQNLFYKNGTEYILRGDVAKAMGKVEALTVAEGETMRFSGNATYSGTITNYGTMYVTPGTTLGRVLNYGKLIVTGEMNIKELENYKDVDFTGTIGLGTTKITNYSKFYCHGNHNGWTKVSNFTSGNVRTVICDNPGCTVSLPTGYTFRPWKMNWADSVIIDLAVVDASHGKNDWVTVNDTFSFTLQPTESYYLPPRTIEVRSAGSLLKPGKDTYEYDYRTGRVVVYDTTYALEFFAVRDLSRKFSTEDSTAYDYTQVELDVDRFEYDGTEKCPTITKLIHYRNGKAEYPTYGVDYDFKYLNNVEDGTGYVYIYGKGDWYQGAIYIPFEIYRRELNEETVEAILEEGTWTYTAKEIKPAVQSVTFTTEDAESVTLVEGQDYQVSYENNTNAGTGKVLITGMGLYKGTVTKEFTIDKASLKNVTVTNNVVPYTGEYQELAAKFFLGDVLLTEDVDYYFRVAPSKLLRVGESKDVTIHATGDNFETGSFTFTWKIVERSLEGLSYRIHKYSNLTYTGYPQTPKNWYLEASDQSGNAYYVSGNWSEVTNVGDSITFTARGNDSGTIEFNTFVMSPRDVSDLTAWATTVDYNGQPQSPKLNVWLNNGNQADKYTPVEGVDYTVSGTTSATEPGTYEMTITGMGNFIGTRKVEWSILPVDLSSDTVTLEEGSTLIYNGDFQTPDHKLLWTDANGNTLEVPGSWTTVMNVKDTSTFTPNSKYFKGTYEISNVVSPLDVTDLVQIDATMEYCGYEFDGRPYVSGYSFTGSLQFDQPPINVGTYTATITASGNFTGTATRTLTVVPATLEIHFNVEEKFYDGTTDAVLKDIVVEGARGDDVFTVDTSELVYGFPSADAGFYTEMEVSGMKIIGDNLENYTYDDTKASLAFYNYAGVAIMPYMVYINAYDQSLVAGETPNQDEWDVDWDFYDKFYDCTVTDVVLEADLEGLKIVPQGGKVIRDEDGADMTKNFTLMYSSADLFLLCDNHQPDQDGFCHNCDGFEAAVRYDNGTPDDEYDDCYRIYNAGQLYWFAQQVNDYGQTGIDAELMRNIVVPDSVSKGGTIPDWTPIDYLYADFNGNGYSISGLYTQSDATYVGFYGMGGYYPIRNLTLKDCYFEGERYVGGLAGYNQGEIVNCIVASDVVLVCAGERAYVGGLCGHNTGSIYTSYTALDSAVGYMYSGYGSVENCYFQGTEDDQYGCIAKTEEEFASGEVAYLLQSGVMGEDIYDDDWNYIETVTPQIWGQTIGKDAYPVIGGRQVYQITTCRDDLVYSNINTADGHIWIDGSCTAPNVCSICGTVDDKLGHTWMDATCTEPKTCTLCGTTEGNALGHNYEGNVCTGCGEPEPYQPVAPAINLQYPTVSFKDEVLINIYFEAELNDAEELGLITFSTPVDSWTVDNAEKVIPGYRYHESEGLYSVTTAGIPAKKMGDSVWFAIYYKLCDGSYGYTELYSYSATEYAYSLLGTEGEKLDALLVSMLNYGTAAQLYFNYKTDDLMNKGLTEAQKALVTDYSDDMVTDSAAVPAQKQGAFAGTGGFTDMYPSATFGGAFALNYYGVPKATPVDAMTLYYWDEDTYAANEVLTAENACSKVEMTASKGVYTASIRGIPARKLNSTVYVAFVYSDGTTMQTSGILPYSLGEYCGYFAGIQHEFTTLAKTTAVYGFYAKQYFG